MEEEKKKREVKGGGRWCFLKRICILGFGGRKKKMISWKIFRVIRDFWNLPEEVREDIILFFLAILSIVGLWVMA